MSEFSGSHCSQTFSDSVINKTVKLENDILNLLQCNAHRHISLDKSIA